MPTKICGRGEWEDHPALQSHSAPRSGIVSNGIVMGEDGNTELQLCGPKGGSDGAQAASSWLPTGLVDYGRFLSKRCLFPELHNLDNLERGIGYPASLGGRS